MAQVRQELEQKLASGDAAAIATLQSASPLEELFDVLMLSLRQQFGVHSNKIKEAAIMAIKRTPGHAKVLGDEIDELSNLSGTGRSRERKFYLLQNIASPEAVAQLGRFLFDERNPEKDIPLGDGSFEAPNSYWAANAIGAALGDPLSLKRKPGYYGLAEVKSWQTWWQSQEAAAYKPQPEPSSDPSAAPAGSPNQTRLLVSESPRDEPDEITPLAVWAAITGAVIALVFLLHQRRKSR
ncbi:MAG: hypothetical protein ACO1TE_05070 [Prosthecobacter sp.]